MEMVDQFSSFILQGVRDLNITDLLVEFHGGEPLLQRKDHFVKMYEKIKSIVQLSNLNSIEFALQTNGILIDTEWIKIFKEYDVGIGISLDGTKKLNDTYRLDKNGNSTYEKVVNKIRLCQENEYRFGLLSVINPQVSGTDVYNHFTKELKLNHFDFLLPNANYGSLPTYHPERYGRFMVEVLDEWIKENSDNPRVFIRYCINALELFYGHYSRIEGFGKRSPFVLPLICVSNNGDLGPLDELRTCIPHKFTEYNITNTSWSKFLSDGFFNNFLNDMENKPDACKQCCYENICGRGSYGNRLHPTNTSFNNPSVYCEGLKIFWHKVIQFLLEHGFSQERLRKVLLG